MTGPKVLILVENLPVPFDRRVWQEALALRDAGFTVSVISPKGRGHDAPEEVVDGIHVFRHDLPLEARGVLGYVREYGAALWAQLRLARRIRRRIGFDVIQACNPPDLMFLTALPYVIGGRCRFVFDHHDLVPELFEVKFGGGLLHRLTRLAERATFALADASIATNETFRDIAIARGRMNPDRVRIVRSYPDLTRFRRTDPPAGMRREGAIVVGYVGIIGEQDGVDLLVRAMAHLAAQGRDDIDCVVVGDGPALAGCRDLAASLGVTERVRFTGYLSGDALLAHLSAFDIGVIPDPPNPFNDKLSMNKVFEYSAMGVPIVMYDLAQARREAGAAARVAPRQGPEALAETLAGLADDPEARRRMGDAGRRRAAETFTWESQKPALIEAYRIALGSDAETRPAEGPAR